MTREHPMPGGQTVRARRRRHLTAVELAAEDRHLDWVLLYRALHGIPVNPTPRERVLLIIALRSRYGWNRGELAERLSIGGKRLRTVLAAADAAQLMPDLDEVPV